jgi:hypothetical protein
VTHLITNQSSIILPLAMAKTNENARRSTTGLRLHVSSLMVEGSMGTACCATQIPLLGNMVKNSVELDKITSNSEAALVVGVEQAS